MFWTEAFINSRRAEWLNQINKAQYCVDGVWQDAEITEKYISSTGIKITTAMGEFSKKVKISGIRFLNKDEEVVGEQSENLEILALQGIMSVWDFSIYETL